MSSKRIEEMNLSDLRTELANRIKAKEDALLEDKRKLAVLEGLVLELTGRQKTLDLLESNKVEIGPNKPSPTLRYADMRMVDAILDILRKSWGTPITIRAVAERLVQGGYQPEGKHFLVTIRNALKRFAAKKDSNVFKTTNAGGQVAFLMRD